ncbi:SgcJ/EcaC family oxidoreductase [Kineobactrum salinum]|uniref:Nuclear transport factor 2 family protein n=1 Tax=Kineobactrum salinum TaxID=2708301 RepID=A0A6C0U0H3_9GAMM|nr:nuclear transport factor 2 family protein [Kineobactrum salinum]QIB65283.1 nuclear transport factor 2 family protein [Kineobactrum salinum]
MTTYKTGLRVAPLLLALMLSVNSALARAQPPLEVAQQMVAAWEAVDLDRVVELFAEDGVLHSMMGEPVVGRAAIRSRLGPMFAGIEQLELSLRNVVVRDNTVFLERVDKFVFRGKSGAVPVVGVLEIEDGRVKVWREYYDRAELFAEMGLPLPEAEETAD